MTAVRKSPGGRKWQPTPVSLPGNYPGQRSLVGYSPWGSKETQLSTHAYKTGQDLATEHSSATQRKFLLSAIYQKLLQVLEICFFLLVFFFLLSPFLFLSCLPPFSLSITFTLFSQSLVVTQAWVLPVYPSCILVEIASLSSFLHVFLLFFLLFSVSFPTLQFKEKF